MAIVHDGLGNTSERISGMGKKLGVSGDSDLQQFFDSSQKNQLWYFNNFTTKFSNGKWMRYKPQKIDTVPVGPLTDAQRKSGNWGIANVPWWNSARKMASWCSLLTGYHTSTNAPTGVYFPLGTISSDDDYWKYDDPKDWASTSYRRAEDFENAWNLAQCPLLGLNGTDEYIYYDETNRQVYVEYLTAPYLNLMGQYVLQFSDFINHPVGEPGFGGDMYFGVMFVRLISNVLYWGCITQRNPIGRAEEDGFDPYFILNGTANTLAGYGWRIFPFLSAQAQTTFLYRSANQSDWTGTFIALPTQNDLWPSTYKEVAKSPFHLEITGHDMSPAWNPTLGVEVFYTISDLDSSDMSQYPVEQRNCQVNTEWVTTLRTIHDQAILLPDAQGNFNGNKTASFTAEYAYEKEGLKSVKIIVSMRWKTGSVAAEYEIPIS